MYHAQGSYRPAIVSSFACVGVERTVQLIFHQAIAMSCTCSLRKFLLPMTVTINKLLNCATAMIDVLCMQLLRVHVKMETSFKQM